MKACCQCGEILGYDHFLIWRKNASMTKNYYSKNCKPCIRQEQRKLHAIKKLFPPPKAGTTPCACCGRIDRLFPDHDWSIDDPRTSFRGYICKSCNVGLGHLGDSLAGVQKAANYLEKAEIRSTGYRYFDAFAMDTENSILAEWRGKIIKGPQRIENKEWAQFVKDRLEDSDLTWEEYCEWVRKGGGDEWFQITNG